jgi:tryptophanyl-tRNA synthetase
VEHVAVQCASAGWGCIDCKRGRHESMERELVPIRRRAAELRSDPKRVQEVLADGGATSRRRAHETMAEVRARMGFDPPLPLPGM